MKKPFGLKRASRIWAQIGDTLGTCSFEEDQVRLLSVLAQNSFSISDDSSDTSDCGGRDNQLMASSEDESSSDSESEDKIPPKYSAVVNHPSVLKNCASSDEVTTPCDPHASHLNNNSIPPFTNAETFIASSKDQNGNSPSDPISEKTAVVEDKMEWVFTLYDFDGKGSLTKEDIGSLARSIYDVLGNAKVPLQSKSGGANRAGQAIGAFRVKLTVVAESDELDKKQQQHSPSSMIVNDPQKSTNITVNGKADDAAQKSTSMKQLIANATTVGDRHESKKRRKMSSADQRYQQEKMLRRRSAGRYPPPPLWQHPPPWQRCACNSQSQDYVNLSELENCCTKHNAAHSNGVHHHVRHCEQHCNCPDRKLARPQPRCFPCGSLRNCCTNPGAPSGPSQPAPPPPSTRRNPFQRTASTGQQGRPARARSPSSTDHVIGGSPCGLHERKHRERDKQYDRSMRLVRQWLIDGASTIDDDPRMQPLRRSFVQHRHIHEHHHYVHHADV